MSEHDDEVSLHHMLDHSREAVQLLHGKTRSDIDNDRLLQLSLTKLIEIVGEAATRLSTSFRQKHPQIPWPQIIGMRNRLIHGYDIINWDLLWDTVADELPPLIQSLESILKEEFK